MDLAVPANHRVKMKGNVKIEKIPGPYQKTKNVVKHLGDGDIKYSSRADNGLQSFGKRQEALGYQRKNCDHPNYSIVKID